MRQATEQDFDFVYDVYMEETINPFMTYEPCDKPAFRAIFDELLARSEFWVVQEDGTDCGIVTVIKNKGRASHMALISTLGILKAYQGKGIGRRTIETLLDRLKVDGFRRAEIGVEADNPRAQKLYENMGFDVQGRILEGCKRTDQDDYVDQVMLSMNLHDWNKEKGA